MASDLRPRLSFLLAIVAHTALVLSAQALDKELVATISGPALAGGIVSGLAWDGNVLVVQSAAAKSDGTLTGRYYAVAGRGMELRPLPSPPDSFAAYWKMKAGRVSPTGLGHIELWTDTKMPVYGIASQQQRIANAVEMGGMITMHELRIGSLTIHRRRDVEPYDGEVWSWSPLEVNRVAYVDEKGDLWVAGADGRDPTRLAKGSFTLPAWSPDGGLLAVAERSADRQKWQIFVIHLNEKLRSPVGQ